MTDEELLLGPLLPRGKITTVTGRPGEEMATLAASIAVSYRTGIEIIPGWAPAGPGVVTVLDYVGTRIEWTGLVRDICDDAQIAVPVIDIQFPIYLRGQELPEERDPDAEAFWAAVNKADATAVAVEAGKTGGRPQPHLWIVYGSHAAAPSDGLMLRLYKDFTGRTALLLGAPSAFTEESWAADELRASDFGPVLRLEDVRDQVAAPTAAANGTGGVLRVDHSTAAKASATEVAAAAEAAASEVELLSATNGAHAGEAPASGPGILYGYAMVWGEWSEFTSSSEGDCVRRYVFGSFARTIRESWPGRKSCFCHGKDPRFGAAPLGPIIKLAEDSHGLYYEVQLLDTALNRELAQGLRAGLYGSSITYRPIASVLDTNPGKSPWNPRGLPEETVTECLLQELGPVREPQFKGTSARLRTPVAPAGEMPLMLEESRAFFSIEGAEALSAFLRDGHSVASQRIKAKARAQGITPGRLWKAAVWLARDAALDGAPGPPQGVAR